MNLAGLVILALVTLLVMRRRGRVFLEKEEGIVLAAFSLLAIVQKLASGSVNLNDHFITPLYFALPVLVGHTRGPARGASSSILGGAAISLLSIAFAETGAAQGELLLPGQHAVLIVVLGVTGACAGLRLLPKALKPVLAASWLLVVAAYHPEYLESVSAYVTMFASIALASLGLYLNPIRPAQSVQIHYPATPSRRA